jgi:protein gp37
MAKDTHIEWTDSTLNAEMGCDGCELYNPKLEAADPDYKPECYAKIQTDRYAGHSKGYPEAFNKPKLFTDRIALACKWADLTGKSRPTKPWLNGLPRTIFLDDMGDTFTESLPLDWLAPFIPAMEAAPHIWQLLTKRPERMRTFFERYGHVPKNFWLMTSVTDKRTAPRIHQLLWIAGARDSVRGISYEPAWGPIADTDCFRSFLLMEPHEKLWVIIGGQSGPDSRPFDIQWARDVIAQCKAAGVPVFYKQGGASNACPHDRKGGHFECFPLDLQVREFPNAI